MAPNEFDLIIKQVKNKITATWRQDIYDALTMGAQYVFGMAVRGDIAEFGTMTARTATALATATAIFNNQNKDDLRYDEQMRHKKVWFFDSFSGLPEARFEIDQNSHHVASGIWGKGTCRGFNEESFTHLIEQILPLDDFRVVKGYFKDTISTIDRESKFSLIHMDADLYESCIDVLEHLFENKMISPGAMFFFDDWNCNAADPKLGERRAWSEIVDKYKVQSSDEGSYSYAGHRYIIHDYS